MDFRQRSRRTTLTPELTIELAADDRLFNSTLHADSTLRKIYPFHQPITAASKRSPFPLNRQQVQESLSSLRS